MVLQLRHSVALAVAVVAVAVAAGGGWLLGRQQVPETPGGPPVASSVSAETAFTATAAPKSAPDAGEVRLVSTFVDAWLDRDPTAQAGGLSELCTPRLAELLADTDPGRLPDAAPVGAPLRAGPSEAGVGYRQVLSDGSVIVVDLIVDPEARFGWLVASVRPAER